MIYWGQKYVCVYNMLPNSSLADIEISAAYHKLIVPPTTTNSSEKLINGLSRKIFLSFPIHLLMILYRISWIERSSNRRVFQKVTSSNINSKLNCCSIFGDFTGVYFRNMGMIRL